MSWEVPTMQSGRSFFNGTIYKKTLLRCWPLWALYIALWIVVLPASLINCLERGRLLTAVHVALESATRYGAIIGFVFGVGVAMAVFGWMYNTRSTGFACTLPVSRTAHYVTALAAGLTMLLGGNVVVFLCTALVESVYGGLDMASLWQWLGWVSLLDIHFFGFAACCAMLTGHLLALPAVYAIFQFTAVAIQGTVYYILEYIVWGMAYGNWTLGWLSPIWTLPTVYPSPVYEPVTENIIGYVLEGWGLPLLYAGAGVALAALGWLLFRRRRMETATDVVAIDRLKPVFRWCLALAGALGVSGLLLTLVMANRSGGGNMTDALIVLAAMLIGGFLGWFAADMLMRKTIRVFRLHWKGWLVFSALIAVFVLAAELDVTGYERRLPDREEIGSVYVSCSEGSARIDEPENIDLVLALHESVIENRDLHEQRTAEDGWYIHLSFQYSAPADENGESEPLMSRSYVILVTDALAANSSSDVMLLEELLNTKEAIRERKETNLPVTVDTITSAHIAEDYVYDQEQFVLQLKAEEAYELYTQCILPDIADGTLGRVWLVTDEEYEKTVYNLRIGIDLQRVRPDWTGDVHVTYVETAREAPPTYEQAVEIPYEYDYFYTVPTVDSWRTNAWLEYHGVPLETLWELWSQAD